MRFILFYLLALAVGLLLSGCALNRQEEAVAAVSETSSIIFGPASLATFNNFKIFYWVGGFLAILGGVGGFVFRSPLAVFSLAGTGIALGGAAACFSEFPWILLAACLGGLLLMAAHVIISARTIRAKTQAETVIATAIEKAPGGDGVKQEIKGMGTKAVKIVKKVITPIKDSLART